MPRKGEVVRALAWLSKWLGGRRDRLLERIQQYEAQVLQSIPDEAAGDESASFQLYGFTLCIERQAGKPVIAAIEPPEIVKYDQVPLFQDEGSQKLLE